MKISSSAGVLTYVPSNMDLMQSPGHSGHAGYIGCLGTQMLWPTSRLRGSSQGFTDTKAAIVVLNRIANQ